jgi:hypothetical protein
MLLEKMDIVGRLGTLQQLTLEGLLILKRVIHLLLDHWMHHLLRRVQLALILRHFLNLLVDILMRNDIIIFNYSTLIDWIGILLYVRHALIIDIRIILLKREILKRDLLLVRHFHELWVFILNVRCLKVLGFDEGVHLLLVDLHVLVLKGHLLINRLRIEIFLITLFHFAAS